MVSFSNPQNVSVSDQGEYVQWNITGQSFAVPDSGETVSNVLVSNPNQHKFFILCRNDCTIQNLGFEHKLTDYTDYFIGIKSPNVTLDTIYIPGDDSHWGDKHPGGGGASDGRDIPTGVFTFGGIGGGQLTMRRVYIKRCSDNGAYMEHQGSRADVVVEDSYMTDTYVSGWRPGPGSLTLRNCHAEGNNHQDVWVRPDYSPTVRLEDGCQMAGLVQLQNGSGTISDDSDVGRVDGNIQGGGRNPTPQVPDGCPTSAVEAATGSSGGRSDPPACVRDIV